MLMFSKQSNTLALDNNQEWLETNGLGTYASSTILDYPTRKYHGLLVAQLQNPYGKFVLLSRFEEHLNDGVQIFPLSIQHYDNHIDTAAFAQMDAFTLGHNPCMSYRCGSVFLKKETLLLAQQNVVLVKYSVDRIMPELKIMLRPLLAYRSLHDLSHANSAIKTKTISVKDGVIFSPYTGMPSLHIRSEENWQYTDNPSWYYSFAYSEEKARGYEHTEDLFAPGVIELCFSKKQEIIVACSLEELGEYNLVELWNTEIARRIANEAHVQKSDTPQLAKQLKARAANQVILEPSPNTYSIIAGYHWFSQWGRDAMIALPGLTLYSDKAHICLEILQHFAAHEKHGIIPNRIAPLHNAQNDYDSIDSSLLFCWAVQQYYYSTKNISAIKKHLWSAIKNIIHYYQQGTYYNIKQAGNGLIYGGSSTIKLTWMDVMLDNVALTPRNGAAVEINALWYNAVCFVAELAEVFREEALVNELTQLASLVKQSFVEVFWDQQQGYLYDYVNDHEKNNQFRPNQIFAAALPYCVLEAPIACIVIKAVQERLLTPYGLRSLAPNYAHYQGVYEGDQRQRDTAYHNGTVWPWLLGFFTDALLKFFSKEYASNVLQPCIQALSRHVNNDAGINCVSEIFDGDAPHKSRGCILQAWSVAEVIRMVQLLK